MTSPSCPEKYIQVSEIVGMPTLVINRPRPGKSRSSRDLMEDARDLPLDFQVETSPISRSHLSEMIHFEKRLAVDYPRWSTSGKRTSPVRSRILPILIYGRSSFSIAKSAIKRRIM